MDQKLWHAIILQFIQVQDQTKTVTMQNEAGDFVDMYIPRKCSASNRIVAAKDHASVQINIADVDETTGRMTGMNKTYAICGKIRQMGESDDSLVRLTKRDGIIAKNYWINPELKINMWKTCFVFFHLL